MSKVVTVEYDAREQVLRLVEPLEGAADHEQFRATLEKSPQPESESWRPFVGCLAGDAGDDFARALDEMFPIER